MLPFEALFPFMWICVGEPHLPHPQDFHFRGIDEVVARLAALSAIICQLCGILETVIHGKYNALNKITHCLVTS